MSALEHRTLGKVRWRLIPFLFLLYVIAYLDRVNVGYAALDMNRELGFSGAVYGFGSGIFFLSYTLLEIPSNLVLARVGARRWIARIMATWGVVSMAMVFVDTPLSFYVLRFLLGAAEAGFFPGLILYLTHWFPARERARAVALFMTATAMAGVIGAPISSAILQLHGAGGLHGWQWLFIIEGLPAVLLAPVVLRRLTERPADATWLSADEREWLTREMAKEHDQTSGVHVTFRAAATSGRLWALSSLYFCIVIAFYGVSFWLPQIVQATGGLSSATVILLTAIPYVAATIGLVVIGSRSDTKAERRWHVAVPCLIGAAGFVLTVVAPQTAAASLLMLSIAAFGIWGALGPFWAMPTAFLRGTAAAGGIAMVNSIGNIGGFAGPFLIGWVRDATGSFEGGLLTLAGVLVVGAVIAISLPSAPTVHSSADDVRRHMTKPIARVLLCALVAGTVCATAPVIISAQSEQVYDPGNGVTLPVVLREVKPDYTPEAMEQRLQGSIWLQIVVLANGDVGDVEVSRSLDKEFGLDNQAVAAAKQWKFKPGSKGGKPVPVRVTLELTFTLK